MTAPTATSASWGSRGWTDERVDLLKALWADGLSASQIATKLGEITRNSVIGKVHRLGLAGRATTSRIRSARPRSAVALLPSPPAQPQTCVFTPLLPIRLSEPEPAPEDIKLINLKDCMCRWPIGDPKEEGFHFCGLRRSFGVPYCEHHAAIAYNPKARRRRYGRRLPGRILGLKG